MNRRQRGSSFVELVVAILVAGIAIIPIYGLITQGARETLMTRDEASAYHHAAEVLDHAQTVPFDDAFLSVGSGPRNCTQLALDPRFVRTIEVGEVAVANAPYRYKVLRVKVAWQTDGRARALELSRLFFSGGAK